MSNIEKQPVVMRFPLTRRETLLSALFGGALGLALTAGSVRLAEILLGQ